MEKQPANNRAIIAGIAVNVLLSGLKLIIGYLTNAISIISDGYNNLSDIGNSFILLVSYHISNKPADSDHPYGHGRFEYIMSQTIALVVMAIGVLLFKSSVERLIEPKPVTSNGYVAVILVISIILKLFLAHYYRKMYEISGITTLKANVTDSLSDAASTTVTLIGYYVIFITDIPVDAIIGIIVSLLIIRSAYSILREMTSILIGEVADSDLYHRIEDIIKADVSILNMHDLRLHSYGNERIYGSCDVIVDGNMTVANAHRIIDALQEEILQKTSVELTMHMDPQETDSRIEQLNSKLHALFNEYDLLEYHDLHYNDYSKRYIVDVVIPFNSTVDESSVIDKIRGLAAPADIDVRIDRV